MLFHNIEFFLFFIFVFLFRWYILPFFFKDIKKEIQASHVFLLIVSYFFYMSWDYRFGLLILLSTLIDYYLAILIVSTDSQSRKKFYLFLSVFLNILCVLGFFKYYNFFVNVGTQALSYTGLQNPFPILNIILPVGISFFTFQSLSYTIDVYRNQIPAERSPVRFALFVSFFPQLVAGPIVTAKSFLPQLFEPVAFENLEYKKAIRFFMMGYFKKVILSDNMAGIVDKVFHSPEAFGTEASWVAAFLFIFQIYCDFSGYSDMAYSAALLFGYKLPENFRMPYLAHSITEFWGTRWHLSLSVWIRDYVYIPLGGSRVSYWRHKYNLFITMVIAGFWHGASWTFIIWGAIQGVVVVMETIYTDVLKKYSVPKKERGKLYSLLRILVNTIVIALISVWFRAESVDKALVMLKNMLVYKEGGLRPYMINTFWVMSIIIAIGHWFGYLVFEKKQTFYVPTRLEYAIYVLLVFVFAIYTNDNEIPFVYFQF
jgi:alginate O-acetyltransferase complex protein AlgI